MAHQLVLILCLFALDIRDISYKLRWLGPANTYSFRTGSTSFLVPQPLVPTHPTLPERIAHGASGWPSFLSRCSSLHAIASGTFFLSALGTNCSIPVTSNATRVVPQIVMTSNVRVDSLAWASCSLLLVSRRPAVCQDAMVASFNERYMFDATRLSFDDMAVEGSDAEAELLRLLDMIGLAFPISNVICVEAFELPHGEEGGVFDALLFGCASPNDFQSEWVGFSATSVHKLQQQMGWLTNDRLVVMGMQYGIRQNTISCYLVSFEGDSLRLQSKTKSNFSSYGPLYAIVIFIDIILLAAHVWSTGELMRWLFLPQYFELMTWIREFDSTSIKRLRPPRQSKESSQPLRRDSSVSSIRQRNSSTSKQRPSEAGAPAPDKLVSFEEVQFYSLFRRSFYRRYHYVFLTTLTQVLSWPIILPNSVVWTWSDSLIAKIQGYLCSLKTWVLIATTISLLWEFCVKVKERWAYKITKGTYITNPEILFCGALSALWLSTDIFSMCEKKWGLERQRINDFQAFPGFLAHGNTYNESNDRRTITDLAVLRILYYPLLAHATVLARLLGDHTTPRARPSRDIAKLLDGIVPVEKVPAAMSPCSWISSDDGRSHSFPLQHAVDFVFVTESTATRIAKTIRDGIGEAFFSPPTARSAPPTARPAPPTARSARRRRGSVPVAPPDSLFSDDSEANDAASCPITSSTAPNSDENHELVIQALAAYPDALNSYLAARARVDAPTPRRAPGTTQSPDKGTSAGNRQYFADHSPEYEKDLGGASRPSPIADCARIDSHARQDIERMSRAQPKRQHWGITTDHHDKDESAHGRRRRQRFSTDDDDDERRMARETFRPTASQRQVHELLSSTNAAGTSPHEFVQSLLSHAAVSFAPHPAILTRLYDFQFGILGLSIAHLVPLEPSQRMEWVMASKEKGTKVNMQNFSMSVDLPPITQPHSIEAVKKALTGLTMYCDAFGSPVTRRIVQAINVALHETTGLEFWSGDDLKYLVYWIDLMLERYRTAVLDDTATRGDKRIRVCESVTPAEPELQRLHQLVTAKKLQQMLTTAQRAFPITRERNDCSSQGRTKYGPLRTTNVSTDFDYSRRAHEAASMTPASRLPPHIRAMIPRYQGRDVCLRFLSADGCRGADGDPNECVYFKTRCHHTPSTPLPAALADFIESKYKGLRSGVRRE